MLHNNAISFLQKRFPTAPVMNNEQILLDVAGNEIKRIYPMIAQDPQTGIKQRAVAIENLGDCGELEFLAGYLPNIFEKLDGAVHVIIDNVLHPTGQEISSSQMAYAPRIILYTNKLVIPYGETVQVFNKGNMLIDLIDESKIHQTLFISYGRPDEKIVSTINNSIKSRGVKTWFFPDDAVPGQKLHRFMHDGINDHDRVLLVCSKTSLSRMGVLNEIERVLEREAREGGIDVLLPVTLDDYVYSNWAPDRKDLSTQVRSRVITRIAIDSPEYESSIDKIGRALKK